MKKRLVILLLIFSFLLYSNETIQLAVGEWAPFTSEKNKDGKLAEIIVSEAFKFENLDVEYIYFPWNRSYESVKKGIYVGTFPWFSDKEREKDFIINKEAIFVSKNVFFHLKELDFDWEKIEDLKKYRVGATVGYSDVKILENNGIFVDIVSKEELNFKKILKKRIDVFATNYFVGYSTLNKLFTKEEADLFTNHPKSFQIGNAYMLISRNISNGQEIADKLDSGLIKLKKSGRYDKIINEYFGLK